MQARTLPGEARPCRGTRSGCAAVLYVGGRRTHLDPHLSPPLAPNFTPLSHSAHTPDTSQNKRTPIEPGKPTREPQQPARHRVAMWPQQGGVEDENGREWGGKAEAKPAGVGMKGGGERVAAGGGEEGRKRFSCSPFPCWVGCGAPSSTVTVGGSPPPPRPLLRAPTWEAAGGRAGEARAATRGRVAPPRTR